MDRELIIVRHGRSRHNMRLTDDIDSALTAHGILQAENVGRFLADKFDSMNISPPWLALTSPFLRCLQTTLHITKFLKTLNVRVKVGLREYLNHTAREVTIPVRSEEFSDYSWVDSDFHDQNHLHFTDEVNEVFLKRMWEIYKYLPTKSLVVTHGLPALMLEHIAIHKANYVPIWDESIDNCSITWIKDGRAIWHGKNLHHEVEYEPKTTTPKAG